MRADSLEKGLQSRPNPEELVKKGILEGTPTISSFVHVMETPAYSSPSPPVDFDDHDPPKCCVMC